MAGNIKNELGKTYGKLTVIKQNGYTYLSNGQQHAALWLCKCQCGNELTLTGIILRSGKKTSCGCDKEQAREIKKKIILQKQQKHEEKQKLKSEVKELVKNLRISGLTYREIVNYLTNAQIKNTKGSTDWSFDYVVSLFRRDDELKKVNEQIKDLKKQTKNEVILIIKNLIKDNFSCEDIATELIKRQVPLLENTKQWDKFSVLRLLKNLPDYKPYSIKLNKPSPKTKLNNKVIDETGNKYGLLTVIRKEGTDYKTGSALWLCKCECGNEIIKSRQFLKIPRLHKVVSCGCVRKVKISEIKKINYAGINHKVEVIQVIKNLILNGLNYTEIAEELTKQKIPKLSGNLANWQRQDIYSLVKNKPELTILHKAIGGNITEKRQKHNQVFDSKKDELDKQAIGLAKNLLSQGLSYTEIAQELTKMGIACLRVTHRKVAKRDNKIRVDRKIDKWTGAYIKSLLIWESVKEKESISNDELVRHPKILLNNIKQNQQQFEEDYNQIKLTKDKTTDIKKSEQAKVPHKTEPASDKLSEIERLVLERVKKARQKQKPRR